MTVLGGTIRFISSLPSLTSYLAGLFLSRFVVMICLLVCVLQVLDLLTVSDDIMAAPDADEFSLLRYVALRAPQLASRFAPFAALLASLIALAELGQKGEITVMRAAGLSAFQILLPVLMAGSVLSAGHFAFHEFVVVDGNARLKTWQDAGYADLPPAEEARSNVWFSDGHAIVRAGQVSRRDGTVHVDRLAVYDRADDGRIIHTLKAETAVYDAGRWQLVNAQGFDIAGPAAVGSAVFHLPPDRFFAGDVVAEQASLTTLMRAVDKSEDEGRATAELQTVRWHRFAAPLACTVLLLLGAISGFAPPRRGTVLARFVTGLGLGFTYFVFENLMLALGKLGTLPALLAAFTPLTAFALIGAYVLVAVDNQ